MGYYVDVHICVSKEDLPILFSCDDMGMFACSYRSEDIVYAYATGLKMVSDWWDNLRKTIEQCKKYHWITVGEDGLQSEDYNHQPMMDVITTIDVPPKIGEVNIYSPKLYQEVFNVLKLSLPKEYEITKGTYIYYNDTDLAYMYTVDNKVYIRRYTYTLVNSINLFKDILNILSNSYMLICISPSIYEIKYKP